MRIKELIPLYLKHLKAQGKAFHTIKGAKSGLRDLTRFLEDEGLYCLKDLTEDLLRDYQQDLAFRIHAAPVTLLDTVDGEHRQTRFASQLCLAHHLLDSVLAQIVGDLLGRAFLAALGLGFPLIVPAGVRLGRSTTRRLLWCRVLL